MIDRTYKLAIHKYPCKSQQPLSESVVLLHGWGMHSESWLPLIAGLENIAHVVALDLPGFGDSEQIPDFEISTILSLIEKELPEKCIVIGWSLGGMLAIQLASHCPHKISKIITLAANTKFVASADYPEAMPLAVNQHFNRSFSTDPAATLKLFGGLLAQGDANERTLLKKIRPYVQADAINSNWSQALQLLASVDNRDIFAQLSQPGLHLLAEKDALVPVSAYQAISLLNARQQVKIIPDAAHALHWSNPELVTRLITDFLLHKPQLLDKMKMAHSFSRAAHTYDSVASLQRTVGERLLQYVKSDHKANVILDLGCGTGYFTPQLQNLFPQAAVIGVDIAEGMLQFASEHHPHQRNWLCADADNLPFASDSIDLIFSNFALQWCTDLSQLLIELSRILKPGGQCIFTSLGPATLHELKTAWAQVDTHVHVNQFHDPRLLLDNLQQAKFQLIAFDSSVDVMKFEHLSDLTRSLKCLGAQNVNHGRAVGLTGRKKIQAFKQAYESFRSNNLLPATYDVFYLKVKK